MYRSSEMQSLCLIQLCKVPYGTRDAATIVLIMALKSQQMSKQRRKTNSNRWHLCVVCLNMVIWQNQATSIHNKVLQMSPQTTARSDFFTSPTSKALSLHLLMPLHIILTLSQELPLLQGEETNAD